MLMQHVTWNSNTDLW